jgi:hypothetical protein
MALLSGVPFNRVLAGIGVRALRVSEDWRRWFQEVKDAIDRSAQRVGAVVALTAQSASVSGSTAVLDAGLYRVSWLLRVTQAATTSSNLQISIGATSGGLATTQSGAALASPAAGVVQSGSVVVLVDAGTAITYATAYASVGATALAYGLSLTVETLP